MQGLELILILLAVAAVLRLASERLLVPFPSLLVLGGLLLAITPGLPDVELDPGVIFLIFIPPLLYLAAFNTSLRDFRQNFRSISLLGVALVLVTMSVVALVSHAIIPELTWAAAFTLGAVVSPPDAVAVTSITKRLGVERVIVTILDGESLLNDATAFVAYRMAVAAVVAGTFSIWEAGLRFVWTAAAGIALGLLIGWLLGRLRLLIGRAPVIENTISLLTPFAVFIPAERLGLASVLAVVAAGFYRSRQGPKVVSAETRLQADATWEMIIFFLEGLIFIIVGLELPVVARSIGGYSFSTLLRYTAIISATLVLVRVVWMFPASYLPHFIRRRLGKRDAYPSWRHILFVGWAGIRGGDSLVIALALPLATATGAPFPGRDLIILLTFAVILVTLVLQGLTLPAVIRLLGLRADSVDEKEESKARLKSARVGLRRLGKVADGQDKSESAVKFLRKKFGHRLHRLEAEDGHSNDDEEAAGDARHADAYRELRLEMIAAEREEVIRLRDKDVIGDDVLRRIQRDLDLEEMLLSSDESDDEDEPTRDERENGDDHRSPESPKK